MLCSLAGRPGIIALFSCCKVNAKGSLDNNTWPAPKELPLLVCVTFDNTLARGSFDNNNDCLLLCPKGMSTFSRETNELLVLGVSKFFSLFISALFDCSLEISISEILLLLFKTLSCGGKVELSFSGEK